MSPEGWDGCISFPRTLSLDKNGMLLMRPHHALLALRKNGTKVGTAKKYNCGPCFEVEYSFRTEEDGKIVFEVGEQLIVEVDKDSIRLNDINYPAQNVGQVRLFVDVSVTELFADDGRFCISRTIDQISDNAEMEIRTSNTELVDAELHILGSEG